MRSAFCVLVLDLDSRLLKSQSSEILHVFSVGGKRNLDPFDTHGVVEKVLPPESDALLALPRLQLTSPT